MAPFGCNQIRFFLALLLLAALGGCTKVGPNYVRPETSVASDWLEAGDPRLKTDPAECRTWWKVFKDPALDRLIETAYQENLTVRQAGVRVLEARAQLGIATGQLYPQTQQATGSIQRTVESAGLPFAGSSTAAAAGFSGLRYWQAQLGLTASWELDFWGKFRRGIESADASLQASVADYDNALVSLTANVANFYTLMRTVERRLAIAKQNVETEKESLTIAQARFEGGTTSQRDVEQAKAVLTSTQATIPVLLIQLRQAKDAISVLLGMPPEPTERIGQGAGCHPHTTDPGSGGHSSRPAAPAPRYSRRRIQCHSPMRPDWGSQSRAFSSFFLDRELWLHVNGCGPKQSR